MPPVSVKKVLRRKVKVRGKKSEPLPSLLSHPVAPFENTLISLFTPFQKTLDSPIANDGCYLLQLDRRSTLLVLPNAKIGTSLHAVAVVRWLRKLDKLLLQQGTVKHALSVSNLATRDKAIS